MQNAEELGVEWLILADAAQISGNKLFLLGGGWDQVAVRKLPITHRMAIAVSFHVPWNETNQKHSFEIEITDSDGGEVGKVAGQFEVGRPTGIPKGSSQRSQLALDAAMEFKALGPYMIVTHVDGREQRTFTFNVIAGAGFVAVDQQSKTEGEGSEDSK